MSSFLRNREIGHRPQGNCLAKELHERFTLFYIDCSFYLYVTTGLVIFYPQEEDGCRILCAVVQRQV